MYEEKFFIVASFFLDFCFLFFHSKFFRATWGRQQEAQVLEIHLWEDEVYLFTIHIHTHNLLHFYNAGDQMQASSVELLDDL